VNWQKSPAARHVLEQRRFLFRGDGLVVRVDHQCVVLGEGLGVEIGHVGCVRDVDALWSQGGPEHRGVPARIVVLAVVAEKQHLDLTPRLSVSRRVGRAGHEHAPDENADRHGQ
jgi:hypothetical protein